jgi:hypothetical protein
LTVEAKDRNGAANPYVTFFIDKEFKTLKNYPPYTYNWDTTTTRNGWHTVEAMGYLETANVSTTRKLRVFVDNPGGNTVRMSEIPDLAAAAAAPVSRPRAIKPLTIPLPKATGALRAATGRAARAATGAAAAAGAPSSRVPVTLAAPSGPARLTSGLSGAPGLASGPSASGLREAPTAATATVARVPILSPGAAAAATPRSPVTRRGAIAAAARTPDVRPVTLAAPRAPVPAANLATAPRSQPAVRAAAAPSRPSVVSVVGSAGTGTAAAAPSRREPRAAVRPSLKPAPGLPGLAAPLQVAFNGERIAFDVAPRVEAGLPLAPFRQIFEHTGGTVTWVPATRVVRAVNADREIVIAVGKKTARVNDQTFTLDKPAFVESGRTIVPLNFVGQALNVDVQYDPATGRLQITSK